jgi:hypothetical protein
VILLFIDAVALLTTMSKLHIAYGVVRISARMVGILLNSCAERQDSNDLLQGLWFVLNEPRRREFESAALGYSELLIEAVVLMRMQGAMSYKSRPGLDVKKELKGSQ